MPFTLHPATSQDTTRLSHIFQSAFSTDPHTRLKSFDKPKNYQADIMKPAIESWVQSTKSEVMKAVDDESDEILGWCCWGSHEPEKEKEGVESNSERGEEETGETEEKDPREKLGKLTNKNMTHWIKKIMPASSSCMYIICIVLDPSHQSRGVGSALISHGTEKADEKDVFCWVQSSMNGYKAFEKAAFEESKEDRLEVDLDNYVPEDGKGKGGEEGGKWGSYVWRCMVRKKKSEREGDGK